MAGKMPYPMMMHPSGYPVNISQLMQQFPQGQTPSGTTPNPMVGLNFGQFMGVNPMMMNPMAMNMLMNLNQKRDQGK